MTHHPSIRRRLLAMLILAILAVWLAALLLVYQAAEHEVEEVFDANLARSARILQALLWHEIAEAKHNASTARELVQELGVDGLAGYPAMERLLRQYFDAGAFRELESDSGSADAEQPYGTALAFVARYSDGAEIVRDRSAPDIPLQPDGFAAVELEDVAWRVYTLSDASTGFVVQVGEKQYFRTELVRYITRNTLAPLLFAVPVLALLIWAVVGRALAPLHRVAEQVSQRAADALDPIESVDTPREIHGLVRALNSLFGRVAAALDREHQFTADAAHELRTPLAALKTHLQVARSSVAQAAVRESLDQALDGVDRATHSVQQLLALARADAAETRLLVSAEVNLRDLAVDVVSALSQQAFERDIDLGIEALQDVMVRGDAGALQVMLRNLVDNALRYTPRGGTVTVSVGCGHRVAWLAVADNGPGIAADERERVFDRFSRGRGEPAMDTTGSGLGLSIVRRIAVMHGATVGLGAGLNGGGLEVRMNFPYP